MQQSCFCTVIKLLHATFTLSFSVWCWEREKLFLLRENICVRTQVRFLLSVCLYFHMDQAESKDVLTLMEFVVISPKIEMWYLYFRMPQSCCKVHSMKSTAASISVLCDFCERFKEIPLNWEKYIYTQSIITIGNINSLRINIKHKKKVAVIWVNLWMKKDKKKKCWFKWFLLFFSKIFSEIWNVL